MISYSFITLNKIGQWQLLTQISLLYRTQPCLYILPYIFLTNNICGRAPKGSAEVVNEQDVSLFVSICPSLYESVRSWPQVIKGKPVYPVESVDGAVPPGAT